MRLIELSANQPSFKTVSFNETGLSIILARKADYVSEDNNDKTYNGVGKSLIVALIHFCLGSREIKSLKENLPNWKLTLKFKIGEHIYTAIRAIDNQKVVHLDGQEFTLEGYTTFLESLVFDIPKDSINLSFRSLIARFIRPSKLSYMTYDTFIKKEPDFAKLINNSFLLGIDIKLIVQKLNDRNELASAEQHLKYIKAERKSKHRDSKSDNIQRVKYEDEIGRIEKLLEEFNVAEDFEIERERANKLAESIRIRKNEILKMNLAVKDIEKSMMAYPDVSKNSLGDFWEKAVSVLNVKAVKTIEEVEVFNKTLIADRKSRLEQERKKFTAGIQRFEQAQEQDILDYQNVLKYLDSRGALAELKKLNDKLLTLKTSYEEFISLIRSEKELSQNVRNYKSVIEDGHTEAQDYLTSIANTIIRKNINTFTAYAEQMYGKNLTAGIDISVNERINKERYNIEVKIETDKSDGVNEVKLFCYDWTILKLGNNHRINFLFHDSRLFGGMDERQKAKVFLISHSECKDDFQYIVTVNEDTLNTVKPQLSEDEYQSIILNNIVLELTDESPESKLLGIQVDLDYDK